MGRKKTNAAEPQWAYGIRTCDADGSSHGGFKWDLAVGACNEAPDWKATAECGNGLHANEDGWGDWSLLGLESGGSGKVTMIVKWDPAEAVRVDDLKTKARRMWVVMTTREASLGSVLGFINTKWQARALAEKIPDTATGNRGHAAATGDRGHAAATGNSGHAAATGNSGHAAATGDRGHAAATGYSGHAAATGNSGIAASLGVEGAAKAGPTGAIMLAAWAWNGQGGRYDLKAVFAGMVGQTYGATTIKPDTYYRLAVDGSLEAA